METFTTREGARLLGVSRRTFNRWIESHPVERETGYGPSGVEYKYTRAALEHLLRQVRGEGAASQLVDGSPGEEESEPAQGRQGVPSRVGQDETPAQPLALNFGRDFLDLFANLRDVVARATLQEGEVGALRGQVERLAEVLDVVADENRQLREILSAVAARLPGPPAPPSPPVVPAPRVRWRAVAEVSLLGVVCLLAGAMVAAVARVLQVNGAIVLPW